MDNADQSGPRRIIRLVPPLPPPSKMPWNREDRVMLAGFIVTMIAPAFNPLPGIYNHVPFLIVGSIIFARRLQQGTPK